MSEHAMELIFRFPTTVEANRCSQGLEASALRTCLKPLLDSEVYTRNIKRHVPTALTRRLTLQSKTGKGDLYLHFVGTVDQAVSVLELVRGEGGRLKSCHCRSDEVAGQLSFLAMQMGMSGELPSKQEPAPAAASKPWWRVWR